MPRHSYYVLMQDYGRKGREAVVDPELTRSNIVDRVRRRDHLGPIAFIHKIEVDERGIGTSEDVTNQILAEAGFYDEEIAYA